MSELYGLAQRNAGSHIGLRYDPQTNSPFSASLRSLMTTAFITHADCMKHDMGSHHPECPARLGAIEDQMIASGIAQYLSRYEAPLATDEQIARVHPADYVRAIRDASPRSGTIHLDPDTAMNPHSLNAALHAAGAGVLATDL